MAASLLHNGANINARFFLLHGGDDKYDDNGVDQHHCDDELSQSLMILILIMITMKLNARTAWGDGVSHYAARHGTVCILRFLLYCFCGKIFKAWHGLHAQVFTLHHQASSSNSPFPTMRSAYL